MIKKVDVLRQLGESLHKYNSFPSPSPLPICKSLPSLASFSPQPKSPPPPQPPAWLFSIQLAIPVLTFFSTTLPPLTVPRKEKEKNWEQDIKRERKKN